MTKPRKHGVGHRHFICLIRGEARMTNDETSSNAQMTNLRGRLPSSFGFRPPRRSYAKAGYSFFIRHSTFVILLAFALPIQGEPPPSAKEILDSVRMLESRQQI